MEYPKVHVVGRGFGGTGTNLSVLAGARRFGLPEPADSLDLQGTRLKIQHPSLKLEFGEGCFFAQTD